MQPNLLGQACSCTPLELPHCLIKQAILAHFMFTLRPVTLECFDVVARKDLSKPESHAYMLCPKEQHVVPYMGGVMNSTLNDYV